MAVSQLSLPIPVRRIALGVLWIAAAGVGMGIELLQVFIASHTPSITDVILYATGAAAGMLATIWTGGARS
jgi:VanZ family protein